ncbi:hypothetical protein HQ571_00450 [Candidatus Kuenenbacteria bacterium]|nr:hypothetical protein [Candidatus Kuenenbacteria bacterium]
MRLIGFSSGVLYHKIQPVSMQAIRFFHSLGCNTIELACVLKERLALFYDLYRAFRLNLYECYSLHAPCDHTYCDNEETRAILAQLQIFQKLFKFKYLVFHPHTLKDPAVLEDYSLPIAIENMDKLKPAGQTVADLEKIFAVLDCQFVLDVNHAFTNDPSHRLAQELLNAFGNRLCGVHLSGFVDFHEPLHVTKQDQLIEIIKPLDVPVIIESMCADQAQAKAEFEYIKRKLSS